MIEASTYKFLKQLKQNNVKEWFDKNRPSYENAKQNFIAFIQQVIRELSKTDASLNTLLAKDCIFRINRDVRFAKDKSPYKINLAASINSEGKKSMKAGYYIHLQPGENFIGGGVWQPMPDQLKKIRQEIDYNYAEWTKLMKQKAFVTHYKDLVFDDETQLARPPKGYDANNEAIKYLKLKSFIGMVQLSDDDMMKSSSAKDVANILKALKPVLDFLNTASHEE